MPLSNDQIEWWSVKKAHADHHQKPAWEYSWNSERWPNFSPYEVACRGTGALYVDSRAMDALQNFRTKLGEPFTPNSAYRSESHNSAIGGASRSMHMLGLAFDIPATNSRGQDLAGISELKRLAISCGFQGVGTYSWGIHVDMRDWAARW